MTLPQRPYICPYCKARLLPERAKRQTCGAADCQQKRNLEIKRAKTRTKEKLSSLNVLISRLEIRLDLLRGDRDDLKRELDEKQES